MCGGRDVECALRGRVVGSLWRASILRVSYPTPQYIMFRGIILERSVGVGVA
jgi:hypothetical protein